MVNLGTVNYGKVQSGIPQPRDIIDAMDRGDNRRRDEAKQQEIDLAKQKKDKRDKQMEPMKSFYEYSKQIPLMTSQEQIDSSFAKIQQDRKANGLPPLPFSGVKKNKYGFIEAIGDGSKDESGSTWESVYVQPSSKNFETFVASAQNELPKSEIAKEYQSQVDFSATLEGKAKALYDAKVFGKGAKPTKAEDALEAAKIIAKAERENPAIAKTLKKLLGLSSKTNATEKEKVIRAMSTAIKEGDFVLAKGIFAQVGGLQNFKKEGLKPLEDEQKRLLQQQNQNTDRIRSIRKDIEDADTESEQNDLKTVIEGLRGENARIDGDLGKNRSSIKEFSGINSFDEYVKFSNGTGQAEPRGFSNTGSNSQEGNGSRVLDSEQTQNKIMNGVNGLTAEQQKLLDEGPAMEIIELGGGKAARKNPGGDVMIFDSKKSEMTNNMSPEVMSAASAMFGDSFEKFRQSGKPAEKAQFENMLRTAQRAIRNKDKKELLPQPR